MIYLRYEFNDKEQAEEKISRLEDVNADFIKLGQFVLEEDVLSEGYAVDVLWRDLDASPYGWKTYEVEPSNPKHKLF